MAPKLTMVPGLKDAPRSQVRSRLEIKVLSPDTMRQFRTPPFQRPIKENAKLLQVVEEIKASGGVINGVLTLGLLDGHLYIVDGQHRLRAFELSQLKEGLAEVRVCEFDDMTEMAEEFFRLQDHIAAMTPDDKLRALEHSHPPLKAVRTGTKFVGYGNIRRNPSSPILSMTAVVRMWNAAGMETPAPGGGGAVAMALALSQESADQLIEFLRTMMEAWGPEPQSARMWGSLNLTLTGWLWQRMVMGAYREQTTKLTKVQFMRGCMALNASDTYKEWLVGRKVGEGDRSPCYHRMRQIIAQRLADEIPRMKFPAPAWYSGGGRVLPGLT